MGILEKKGYVTHRRDGGRNVYSATIPRERALRSAMRHLMDTFFEGSESRAILAFLDLSRERLSETELDRISERVRRMARDEAGPEGAGDEGGDGVTKTTTSGRLEWTE